MYDMMMVGKRQHINTISKGPQKDFDFEPPIPLIVRSSLFGMHLE